MKQFILLISSRVGRLALNLFKTIKDIYYIYIRLYGFGIMVYFPENRKSHFTLVNVNKLYSFFLFFNRLSTVISTIVIGVFYQLYFLLHPHPLFVHSFLPYCLPCRPFQRFSPFPLKWKMVKIYKTDVFFFCYLTLYGKVS